MKKLSEKLRDYLELWGFEENFLIYKDGSFGFGYELTPIDCSCFDEKDAQRLSGQFKPFLNGLPSGTSVQLVIRTEKEETFSETDNISTFRNERICDGQIVKQRYLLLFRSQAFSKNRSVASQSPGEILKDGLQNIKAIESGISQSMGNLAFKPRRLSDQELIDFTFQTWNPGRLPIPSKFREGDISGQLLYENVSIHEFGFRLGTNEVGVVSLKSLPEATQFTQGTCFRSLPIGSTLYLSIYVPDQQKEMDRLKQERRLAFSHSDVTAFLRNLEGQAKLNDTETLISELVTSEEKLFYMSVIVILEEPTQKLTKLSIGGVLDTIRNLSGSEAMRETLAAFPIFSEVAWPHARGREREKRVKTSNLIDFLPIFGSWRGHKNPKCFFESPSGTLIGFNPFAEELPNANIVISGMSGSGKSFLTNSMILEFMRNQPKIFILDVGGSYRKLCEFLEGTYLQVSLESDFHLNPFELGVGETEPSPMKLMFLLGLIELMTKEGDRKSLARVERLILEEEIRALYRRKLNPRLSDLQRQLEDRTNSDLRNIAQTLKLWCGESPYGRIFDSAKTQIPSGNPICFDLQGLKSHPDLQSVVLYAITDLIWRDVLRNKHLAKHIVLDECWELLQTESGARFVSDIFRTARKHHAGCVAISQSIGDFENEGRAILTNSATKFILAQRSMEQDALLRLLQLNSTECAIVSQLRKSNGEFTQALLLCGDDHTICEVVPSPLQYWVCTSNPKDLAAEAELRASESKLTPKLRLEKLMKAHPKGVLTI